MKRQRSQLEIARYHLNAWLEADLELQDRFAEPDKSGPWTNQEAN